MNKRIKAIAYYVLGEKLYDSINMRIKDTKKRNKSIDLVNKRLSNKQYKDMYNGKRCFILGNGPSLREVNLELLKDEFVFSVNNFSQVKDFEKANTNVHLWADLSFFNMRDDQKYDMNELMNNYYLISKQNPICFFPEEAKEFLEKNELNKILNINYFSSYFSVEEDKMVYTDISEYITGFSTVVQYAIVIALYMGFKEIYLLGCDATNIVSLLNCAMDISNENMHAYDNDDVNARYKELLKHWTMTEAFYDQYKLFLGYKKLHQKCEEEKIVLYNCSSATLINEIPRKKLSDVLRGDI